jgi:hypothetical protein
MTAEERDIWEEVKRAAALRLLALIGVAALVLGFSTLLASQASGGVAAGGVGGMIFVSAASVGGVLGFLFAVPRVLAQADPLAGAEGEGSADGSAAGSTPGSAGQQSGQGGSAASPGRARRGSTLKSRLLQSNTNLERISDWLTTMLVGVGLSQLGSINGALVSFRTFLASEALVFPPPTGSGPATAGILPAIGPMLLIFGLVMGFLFLYLYTRLVLTALFHQVERSLDAGRDPERQAVGGTAGEAVASAAENLRQTSKIPTSNFLSVGNEPSVADSLRVMFGLLYRPGGYEEVIDLAAKLSNSPAREQAEYWFYLAAAFGQKYYALLAKDASQEELVSARDNALDAARRAVDIDPSYRARLWSISNPDNLDNDLAPFRDDPTFRAIVGAG